MSTLPRTSARSIFLSRPNPEPFDSGLHSSTAWAESQKAIAASTGRRFYSESNVQDPSSLSDDEPDTDRDDEAARPARALYDFSGKPEHGELAVVKCADELEVVRADVGKGWSLVRTTAGEMGLLPREYYTFTSELAAAPGLEIDDTPNAKQYPLKLQEPSRESDATPRASPRKPSQPLPLVPQNTGEWQAFPSFRHSLLGGKSLNRFSTFVTSGAEAFLLSGSQQRDDELVNTHRKMESTSEEEEFQNNQSRIESDRHFLDPGPRWQEKVAPFRVLVHSPSKHTSLLSGAYTMYNVTALFHAEEGESVTRVTVLRRFSHFVVLHTALTRRLPGIALPPLPGKQYAGRFSNDFVEARRGDLERYINKVVRHPVARYAEVVRFFLSCESDVDWKKLLPQHLALPPAGPTFYSQVYHPAFNVDMEDAQDVINLFETHTKAVDKGVQNLRTVFTGVREARIEMSKAERTLSYSLLGLITSKVISPAANDPGVDEHIITPDGLQNSDGAWCWRENCSSCLQLTKAMQKTSETLQSVADLYDDHARRTQLATHESLKSMAHPSAIYDGIMTTHRSTLSRYNEAVSCNNPDEGVASRCETVLNITMAEMDTYHTQKTEDFRTLAVEHLDGEIQLYEQILTRLKMARRNFDAGEYEAFGASPRQTSIYERDLVEPRPPRMDVKPLVQPCPHVFDSAPMRPVSVAIQEGVNLFTGQGSRGSVLGRLWSH